MANDDDIKRDEAAEIISIREGLGMNRAEFSGLIGISASTLRNAEGGRYRLGARRMQQVRDLRLRKDLYPDGAAPYGSVEETPSHYPSPIDNPNVTEEMIVRVLAIAKDKVVVDAAAALEKALGCSAEEALAKVVFAKLWQ